MIKIIKAGILDTVQDDGRFGFAKWGINSNGAMDHFARAVGNALIGNAPGTAVIEMHFPAPQILFSSNAIISITGADFSPEVNGLPVPGGKAINLPAGSLLTFTRRKKGMRCYLSVHGGFAVPSWLGSASTNLKSKTGGLSGEGLKTAEEIAFGHQTFKGINREVVVFPWSVNRSLVYDDRPVCFLPGREWSALATSSATRITTTPFSIESSSDRMASFLKHDPIHFSNNDQLLSAAVTFGTMQALPSGKLCVLMADHQTTGGYPRVGHIITAHLPKFSQLSPGETFSFEETTAEEAEKMLLSLQSWIVTLSKNVHQKLSDHYGLN